ncbi:hypothetical protein [Streptomyces radicis]|uniref:Uncharacterized protein n=1 Tax=Streptomyces radicis TaxID=1750517 RepID=A0A3A9W6V4_9ACTN|nr:hypothetical protein [Streptomyces radicis]RKN08600.1 hypothetical protein D7319_14470 [Streptomyces radicis]RKN21758.1 hypothetical protein D7318_15425 [Streptomyces radicis]
MDDFDMGWRMTFEARRSGERGWYVVDPVGSLVHVPGDDGHPRAAFFGEDRAAAEGLAARLNAQPDEHM